MGGFLSPESVTRTMSAGVSRSCVYKKALWCWSSSVCLCAQVRPAHTHMRVRMERTFREQLFFLVLSLSVLKGNSRYIEVRLREQKNQSNLLKL